MSFLKALPAAALLFLPSSAVTVHSLSVVPSSGKAEVVIGVNAAVDVQDFTLDAPARVVVDLKGATLDMSRHTYDKAWRGGITNIRYSQFRPGIVRVVIELDAKHPYEVKRSDREVRPERLLMWILLASPRPFDSRQQQICRNLRLLNALIGNGFHVQKTPHHSSVTRPSNA